MLVVRRGSSLTRSTTRRPLDSQRERVNVLVFSGGGGGGRIEGGYL